MYPNLLRLLKKDIIIIIQIKKTRQVAAVRIRFVSLRKHKDNQMKFQWKMQEKWKKMTAGVQEFQENGPDRWIYILKRDI